MMLLEVNAASIPIQLLLEADPSEEKIATYLQGALCFAAYQDNLIVAACVTKPISSEMTEIFNIATSPAYQKKGIGRQLLDFTIDQLALKGVINIILGTGSFGYQLSFYQRAGFRVEEVVKDYFLDHYAEPIFESGLQHKDMLRLSLGIQGE